MEIKIKPYTGLTDWPYKEKGVILVEKEEDIDKIYNQLIKVDEEWESYKHLIKVAPKEIDRIEDLNSLCDYTGKTLIPDIEGMQKWLNIPFIVYWEYSDYC